MDFLKFILLNICLSLGKPNNCAEHLTENLTENLKENFKENLKKIIEVNVKEIPKIDDRPRYQQTWESIDSRPLPGWYDEAKIGIFIHWGVYAVPNCGTEMFWWNWKGQNQTELINYMQKNYRKNFSYQEFASLLTAESFNPDEWVEIFKTSGAQYVVVTSKHHDGYTMWPSSYSYSWNSVDVGPHRDIVNDLATSIRKNSNLKFGLYYSLFEWFNPLFLSDKSTNFKEDNYVTNKVIPELKQLVSRYSPDIIWSSGDEMANITYWKSLEFMTWLYNESPVRENVIINDRWGISPNRSHGGFRTIKNDFNSNILQDHKFEHALTIDKLSWGYRSNAKLEDFMTTKELIREIITTVSCGGNIIINIAPDRFGIIQPVFVNRLTDIGNWLKFNGEAIYKSIPFTYQNDSTTPDVWYTKKVSEGRNYVYAMILEYPVENSISLYSVHGFINEYETIHLLGYSEPLEFDVRMDHIVVKFPSKRNVNNLSWAWTLKIVLK